MTIFLSGGGTAGSVTPLLAVAEHLLPHDVHFVGTAHGVERQLVDPTMPYHTIVAGKFRRYWSWRNLIDPVFILIAFFQSLWLIARYQPAAVVSLGSFVALPVVYAAWWCNVPVVIHQSDVPVSLTTRLTKPCATILTKAFASTPLPGADVIGNPVRNLTPTTNSLTLDPQYPTVLIFGGGTGAQALNALVTAELCAVANVIHVTGDGRAVQAIQHQRYHGFPLLGEAMKEAYAKADIVVARAGLGTISELAALGKPAIIIPIPGTHQEANAQVLRDHQAALVLDQSALTPRSFTEHITQLLQHTPQQQELSVNIKKINLPEAADILASKIQALYA